MEDLVLPVVDGDKQNVSEIAAVPKNTITTTTTTTTTTTDDNKIVVVQPPSDDSFTKEASASCAAATSAEPPQTKKKKKMMMMMKQNLIQVSNTKKPFVFYLNLAKKYIRQYNGVELNGLGMAIPTVITISEILKRRGLAIQENVKISTVDSKDADKGHLIQKAKIEIVLGKPEKVSKTIVTATLNESIDATA